MIGHLNPSPTKAAAAAAAPGRPGVLFAPAGEGEAIDALSLGGQRKQVLNLAGLFLAYVGPIFVFIFILNANSFMRYYHPQAAAFANVGAWVILLTLSYFAMVKMRRRAHSKADPLLRPSFREPAPSWYVFLACSCFLAVVLAELVGNYNYVANMKILYGYNDLNSYTEVDPSAGNGQSFLDAGQISFVNTSRLMLSRSMGFYDGTMYCVAPIVSNGEPPAIYDYWAVGVGCCSGHAADFSCGPFHDSSAHQGLRLLRDDQRPFFQLAVQQAESVYQIKAHRPIFFTWTKDAAGDVSEYRHQSFMLYMFAIFCFIGFQTFTTVLAVVLYYPHLGKVELF